MIAVVLVLCLVGALLLSPLGVLFSGETSGGSALSDAIQEINQEFDAKLEELKAAATYDELSLSVTRAPWREVLAVYAVKTTSDPLNGQEVVTMTDEKKELLKRVFWDMNQLSGFTSTTPGKGDEADTTTLYITVTAKAVNEMYDLYGFTTSQRQQLAELLSDEHRELWGAALGYGTGDGDIVAVALSQVGNTGAPTKPALRLCGERRSKVANVVFAARRKRSGAGFATTRVSPIGAGTVLTTGWIGVPFS